MVAVVIHGDSVGFALADQVPAAIALVPWKAWTATVAAEGQVREPDVVEITGLLKLTR